MKTTVRLPEGLYWKFQATKTERKIQSDQTAYIEAVEQWIAQKGHQPIPDSGNAPVLETDEVNKKGVKSGKVPSTIGIVSHTSTGTGTWGSYSDLHADLDYILQNGPKGMATDIAGNIKWFRIAAEVLHDAALGSDTKQANQPVDDHAFGLERARALEHEHRTGSGNLGKDAGRKGSGKKKSG